MALQLSCRCASLVFSFITAVCTVRSGFLDGTLFGSCPSAEPRIVTSRPQIIDISMGLESSTLKFTSATGLGDFKHMASTMDDGDFYNGSQLKDFSAHTGTHVDAPSHFMNDAFHAKRGIESLDLTALNGPVLVVEVPDDTNITASALESLGIPAGTVRVIFRTLNTKKGLLRQTAFEPSYTGITKDGAEWIVERGSIKFVGLDYLSVAHYADLIGPHVALLAQGDIIPVEGLILEDVTPGLYTVHCLPIKLVASDGAPARCILMT